MHVGGVSLLHENILSDKRIFGFVNQTHQLSQRINEQLIANQSWTMNFSGFWVWREATAQFFFINALVAMTEKPRSIHFFAN